MEKKTLKQRIKENPGLKQAVHRFIMHPVKTRPNWWIRLFDFIYLKRGKGSVIYRSYQDAEKMIDEQGVSTLPVVIEDDVWVGANSVILPGVTLGKHCVVAAGSVVSHSVPPYSICAGCPARIIKTYDFETKEWKKVEKTPATNHK